MAETQLLIHSLKSITTEQVLILVSCSNKLKSYDGKSSEPAEIIYPGIAHKLFSILQDTPPQLDSTLSNSSTLVLKTTASLYQRQNHRQCPAVTARCHLLGHSHGELQARRCTARCCTHSPPHAALPYNVGHTHPAATHTLSLVVLTRQVHRKGVVFRRHFRKERHWIKTITIEGVFLQVHAIKSRKTQSITNTRCANGSVCARKKGRELQTHLDHFCHVTFWSCIFC